MRRKFLQAWINIPEGTAAVALNDMGQIVGFGQRRATMRPEPKSHLIGPLYADDVDTAMAVLQRLCQDVTGDRIYIQIWCVWNYITSLMFCCCYRHWPKHIPHKCLSLTVGYQSPIATTS